MLSIEGHFENGTAYPELPVEGKDGCAVIITFLEKTPLDESTRDLSYLGGNTENEKIDDDPLLQLINDCQIRTGIGDLAHQHDHYLYGAPKVYPMGTGDE